MKKLQIKDGHELRGLRVRLYPDRETEYQMRELASRLRRVWNWMVKQGDEESKANMAWAIREGLIDKPPSRPDYNGMSPDEAEEAKRTNKQEYLAWRERLNEVTKGCPKRKFFSAMRGKATTDALVAAGRLPERPKTPDYTGMTKEQAKVVRKEFKERKAEWVEKLRAVGTTTEESWMDHLDVNYDYQLLLRVFRWTSPEDHAGFAVSAHILQAMVKDFYGSKGWKAYKRRTDHMPIRVRSGQCFEEGDFGGRGRSHVRAKYGLPNPSFYNCQVSINGWKIRGRLPGKRPEGRVLEGVSLVEEADGWYASIKVEVPVRKLESPDPGSSIGLDMGLDTMVAFSRPVEMRDGRKTQLVTNLRGRQLSRALAELQRNDLPTGRLHQKVRRQNLDKIYNEVIIPLGKYEVIAVENLSSKVGQLGSSKMSSMRTIISLLKQRYGTRVREVDCRGTSQTCSRCEHPSPNTWKYDGTGLGWCPKCGFSCNRDINAAVNVERRSIS